METAKFIKFLKDFRGNAALYKLSKSVLYDGKKKTKYVVCSTADCLGVTETYIFPANKEGDVIDWGELEGSQKYTSSHSEVLSNAGFEIKEPK